MSGSSMITSGRTRKSECMHVHRWFVLEFGGRSTNVCVL